MLNIEMDQEKIVSEHNPYNISNWSEGYFKVNDLGAIEVFKSPEQQGISLTAIVERARLAGLQLPLLIRFTDILRDRVVKIYQAFADAIENIDYRGSYQLVYPIKVNQEQCVVRELLKTPKHNLGLEAGSKPELMAIIGMLNQASTIVCNGYKDSTYIRTALIAQQMGHKVFIVIEKRSELDTIMKESLRLGIKPSIGVRIRLMTKSAGKWENTGGIKSKFGLNAEQVIDLISRLKEYSALDCLQLMHCHLGSQIANIQDIRRSMQEVARYYTELRSMDAPITTIDVGGGLAVDYEGTRSKSDCSMNYSLTEYATNILLAIRHICGETGMPEPNIISESGRALTAHHAVLITGITDVEIIQAADNLPSISSTDTHVIRDIWDTYEALDAHLPSEIYHYALHSLEEAQSMFIHGVISLQEKARVEQLFTAICFAILPKLVLTNPSDQQLSTIINERLAAKIFCNLSIFQSIPDAWAIGQIFPIAPISHMNNPFIMPSILQDLTCDSDGTLKKYTGKDSIDSILSLPLYKADSPYALGFFLVGAYQEILGNLHNLFGDTNSLDVILLDDGEFEMRDLVSGDTVTNVLDLAHFDTKKLLQSYEKQLRITNLSEELIQSYLAELRSTFSQLTYLDSKRQ